MEHKILVVDDEERLVRTLTQFFQNEGFRVRQALSGEEAIAVFDREPADLVVLDLQMPGLSGTDVLRHIRQKSPDTRVVILTAYANREKEVKPLGYDAFLTKPFAVEKLIELAHKLLIRKDEEELHEFAMPEMMEKAAPGDPLALVLMLEPFREIAYKIVPPLVNPELAKGCFHVNWTEDVSTALAIFIAMHPDLVMIDLLVPQPADVIKEFLSHKDYQPKDYILYLHHPVLPPEEQKFLDSLPAKRWEGNFEYQKEVMTLVELVRRTALEHGLVKRGGPVGSPP